MSVRDERLGEERFRLLLRQLKDEYVSAHGKEWGWKTAVGSQLKLSNDHVGKIERGERGVGTDLIERTMKRLGLRSDFFFELFEDDPDYRDHIGARNPGTLPGAPVRPEIEPASASQTMRLLADYAPHLTADDYRYLGTQLEVMRFKRGAPTEADVRAAVDDLMRTKRGEPDPLPPEEEVEASARAKAKGYRTVQQKKRGQR